MEAPMNNPTLFCDDDTEITLPFRWVICPACNGHGKSSAYLGAYTQSDMDAAGPEFFDQYMAGGYDRACEPCEGTGKTKVADLAAMTKKQREEYRAQQRADREIAAEERAERAFGC
jgi:hypothetical protein